MTPAYTFRVGVGTGVWRTPPHPTQGSRSGAARSESYSAEGVLVGPIRLPIVVVVVVE